MSAYVTAHQDGLFKLELDLHVDGSDFLWLELIYTIWHNVVNDFIHFYSIDFFFWIEI